MTQIAVLAPVRDCLDSNSKHVETSGQWTPLHASPPRAGGHLHDSRATANTHDTNVRFEATPNSHDTCVSWRRGTSGPRRFARFAPVGHGCHAKVQTPSCAGPVFGSHSEPRSSHTESQCGHNVQVWRGSRRIPLRFAFAKVRS